MLDRICQVLSHRPRLHFFVQMKNTNARKGKTLPATVEGLIEGIHRGIRAAAMAPTGAANVADHLSAPQLRMLARLAEKANETPRQFLAGIVSRVTRNARRKLATAKEVAAA